ncbi:MAG TPA: ArsA family ATPase [Solirubrobacteraceae bacterium]|jgi:anion-transporting  ArsA/GET3 family ATPase|nr:ArsA family ATPase [Solirubrobacteraceae bacterium]
MPSVLERRLIVVSGKGGVGKTTVSAALGLLGARRGLRTIVVEVMSGEAGGEAAGMGRLSALLGHAQPPPHGVETQLQEGLWGLTIDRDRVLAEWLRAIGGRVPARVLTASSSFQYLIAAAPGAREMITMVKLWELAQGRRPADRAARGASAAAGGQGGSAAAGERDYDLIVFDAPATGHALAMLRSPHTFGTIARMGPIARQAGQVRELLEDHARTAYLAVTQATEMGVTETLELRTGLRREVGRELDAVVVNGTLPRRFEGDELQRIAALDGEPTVGQAPPARNGAGHADDAIVARSAARAARAVHERTRAQQRQIARLRRGAGPQDDAQPVLRVPFLFRSALDLEAIRQIADRLARGL